MADSIEDSGPKILLGVTGGIAAYKSPELVRRLRDRGAQVQVVMTRSAEAFVSPVTFQAVSGRRVRGDLWDEAAEAAMGHIELARWADLVVVAPATAHCMGSLAGGLAGDLLTTICMVTEAPIILAPAMNQAMWSNPAVQENLELLEKRGIRFVGPMAGDRCRVSHADRKRTGPRSPRSWQSQSTAQEAPQYDSTMPGSRQVVAGTNIQDRYYGKSITLLLYRYVRGFPRDRKPQQEGV